MSRDRFKALFGMLHVVDPGSEEKENKLGKISPFKTGLKEKCQALFQPYQQVAVDERIVKSKCRSGIRQHIKNKPVKFEIKLWVLATVNQDIQLTLTYTLVQLIEIPMLHLCQFTALGMMWLETLVNHLKGKVIMCFLITSILLQS